MVTVVLEGGEDALKAVKESVKYGIPAVVVDGTRRAADILAFAHNNCECDRQVKILLFKAKASKFRFLIVIFRNLQSSQIHVLFNIDHYIIF